MTATHGTPTAHAAAGLSTTAHPTAHATAGRGTTATRSVTVLLYSDDSATRDQVRLAVGRRPARDVEVSSWRECATAYAVIEAVEHGHFDVLVLDGEAAKVGGLGLSRQLKNEIFECPPILVLIGRPQDAWLAAWSQADLAVSHPLDPMAVATAVATLARSAPRGDDAVATF